MQEPCNGAIHNGREFLRRLVEHYDFKEANGHDLAHCYEYQEALKCFEHMAEWIEAESEGWEPSEADQGLIPIPAAYNEP
jgi:hypothetical protein